MSKSFWIILCAIACAGVITTGIWLVIRYNSNPQTPVSPIAQSNNKQANSGSAFSKTESKPVEAPKPISELAKNKIINIVLLGIDRRSREELGYRTDIIILLSINPDKNKVLLTSVPRDLWVGNGRINAVYVQDGWEGIQESLQEITGIKPDRYILSDFADFSWLVDAMGGVPVTVETSFTDTQYPIDITKTYQTISFTQGTELLTGERALIYSRSRKGNNGEGSDWMRMKRQHLILKGMLTAVSQPKSLFNPMVVDKAFNTIVTGKLDTNLNLLDSYYLWDFYKDKDKYKIESVYLNSDYVYNPPMEDYGGAWVLAPIGDSFANFHKVFLDKLNDVPEIVETPEPVVTTPAQN